MTKSTCLALSAHSLWVSGLASNRYSRQSQRLRVRMMMTSTMIQETQQQEGIPSSPPGSWAPPPTKTSYSLNVILKLPVKLPHATSKASMTPPPSLSSVPPS
eukprot:406914-Rhodomonas_salina.2